jgi:hypothetical protein
MSDDFSIPAFKAKETPANQQDEKDKKDNFRSSDTIGGEVEAVPQPTSSTSGPSPEDLPRNPQMQRSKTIASLGRSAGLFATAFIATDARSNFSVFAGSEKLKAKNKARHLTKSHTVSSLKKGKKAASILAVKSALSMNYLSAGLESLEPATFGKALKAKAETFGGRKLSAFTLAAEKKQKSWEAEDAGKVELTLLKDLRAIYDTRDKGDLSLDELDDDEELYTDLALLQREAIRLEPEVQMVIGELFEAVDTDLSNSLEKHEYKELVNVLYECLRLFWDEDLPALEQDEIDQIAEDDWKVDSAGKDTINYDRFVIAMFKLCDVWTDFIDGETYLEFLIALRDRLTLLDMVDGKVRRVLRTKEDVGRVKKDASTIAKEKVAAIIKMYSKDLKRWLPDSQLAQWLSKGASSNLLQGKSSEIVSTMVIKYLKKEYEAQKPLWKKLVIECEGSLRENARKNGKKTRRRQSYSENTSDPAPGGRKSLKRSVSSVEDREQRVAVGAAAEKAKSTWCRMKNVVSGECDHCSQSFHALSLHHNH